MSNLKFYNWQNHLNGIYNNILKNTKYNNQSSQKITEKDLIQWWIQNGIDFGAIIYAENFGTYLAKKNDYAQNQNGQNTQKALKELTSSQLRRFFGALKRLQNEIMMDNQLTQTSALQKYMGELLMLKPQLAYAAARAKTEYAKIHNFYEIISLCIDNVKNKKEFTNFIALVEAIVAYHKVEEERN